jgi:amidase
MFAKPDVQQIVQVAASLGIRLGDEEAALYQPVLIDQLQEFDEFMQSRLDEGRPSLLYPQRAPGHRPSAAEDSYRAWLWKCRIGAGDEGMLAGKTVSYKDHVSVAAIPQCFTSYAMEGFIPDVDATVVRRVLAAGGTVVGKHMMNGFMGDYGLPLNPHGRDRATGGSSSGSGAALAAGEVDVSFGGDQGGSIRIPAAYCGVVGLKPTFGLVSHFGVGFGSEQSVDHVGPMARRVQDVAAALEVVAGYDGYDPRQGRDVPGTLDVMGGLDRGVKGVKIGILEEGFDEPIDSEVRSGVLEAVDVLAQAGAEITKVSVPEHRHLGAAYAALTLEGTKAVFDTGFFGVWAKTYYPTSIITAIDRMWRGHTDMLPPRTKLNHIAAELSRRNYHGAVYAKAQNVRPAYVRAYDEALADVDVLALPTVRNVAPPIEDPPADLRSAIEDNLRRNWMVLPMTYNTKPANYTGHPALAVPCGKVGGLPISLQLVGRFLDDPLLLRVAYAYQESVDWDRLTSVGLLNKSNI